MVNLQIIADGRGLNYKPYTNMLCPLNGCLNLLGPLLPLQVKTEVLHFWWSKNILASLYLQLGFLSTGTAKGKEALAVDVLLGTVIDHT